MGRACFRAAIGSVANMTSDVRDIALATSDMRRRRSKRTPCRESVGTDSLNFERVRGVSRISGAICCEKTFAAKRVVIAIIVA